MLANPLLQLISQILPQIGGQQSNPNSPLAQMSGQQQQPLPSNPMPQTQMPAGGMPSPQGNIAALGGSEDAAGSIGNNVLSSLSSYPTPMLDKYKQMIDQLPQPSDYKPSRTRQVMSALAGMGGTRPAGMWGGVPVGLVNNPLEQQEAAANVRNAPYQQALLNWSAGAKQAGEGAGIEERDIANKRAVTETQQRIDESVRENKARDADREVLRERQQQDANTKLTKLQADSDAKDKLLAERKTEYEETMQRLKDESSKKDANNEAILKFREETANRLAQLRQAEDNSRNARDAANNAVRDAREQDYKKRIEDLSRPKPPAAPTETTVTKTTPGKKGWLWNSPDTTTITKTNKGPVGGQYQNPNPNSGKTREQAITALTTKGKEVNEANIKLLLDHPGDW